MSTSDDLSEAVTDLNNLAKDTVRKVGDQISEQANVLRDATASVRYNTEDFIQTNPWQSVAMATALGFLVGVIVSRR